MMTPIPNLAADPMHFTEGGCDCGGCQGSADAVTPDLLKHAMSSMLSATVPFSGANITIDESDFASTRGPAAEDMICALQVQAAQAYTPADRDALSGLMLAFGAALSLRKVSESEEDIACLRYQSSQGDAQATNLLTALAVQNAADLKACALYLAAAAAAGDENAQSQIDQIACDASAGDCLAGSLAVLIPQAYPQGTPGLVPLPGGPGPLPGPLTTIPANPMVPFVPSPGVPTLVTTTDDSGSDGLLPFVPSADMPQAPGLSFTPPTTRWGGGPVIVPGTLMPQGPALQPHVVVHPSQLHFTIHPAYDPGKLN